MRRRHPLLFAPLKRSIRTGNGQDDKSGWHDTYFDDNEKALLRE